MSWGMSFVSILMEMTVREVLPTQIAADILI